MHFCFHHQTLHQQNHTHRQLQHALRQSEEETASFPYLALHSKLAHMEHSVGLLILSDDAFAVHQTESEALVLLDVRRIRTLRSYLTRIIHLRIVQRINILCRHTMTRVCHRHLHIVILFLCRQFHLSTCWCIFSCIVQERVHHKECQRLVCLHHSLRLIHLQGNALDVETLRAMTQGVEQRLQGKVLDVQRHHTLTYLHPMTQHIVIVVDFVNQFAEILESLTHHLWRGILVRLQLVDFMQSSIKERGDTIHNRHRGQFLDILTLVLLQTLLKHKGLTLQPLFLF